MDLNKAQKNLDKTEEFRRIFYDVVSIISGNSNVTANYTTTKFFCDVILFYCSFLLLPRTTWGTGTSRRVNFQEKQHGRVGGSSGKKKAVEICFFGVCSWNDSVHFEYDTYFFLHSTCYWVFASRNFNHYSVLRDGQSREENMNLWVGRFKCWKATETILLERNYGSYTRDDVLAKLLCLHLNLELSYLNQFNVLRL